MYRDMRQIGLQKSNFSPSIGIVKPPKDVAILNSVYQDEDGNPRNDLGVFQSSETSAEVKNFISNLHKEQPLQESLPEKMRNDDAIIESIPNHGETLLEYEQRVKDMVDSEKLAINTRKAERKFKEVFDSLESKVLSV